MNRQKLLYPFIGFLSGTIFGISLIAMLSFTNGPSMPGGAGVFTVNASQAKAYVGNYMSDAAPSNDIIKGFTIDMGQFEAMSRLSKENAGLSGFRIYLGKNETAATVGIVVGVDQSGKDVTGGSIYGTEAKSLSPCPPICDNSSSIITP